MEEKSKANRRRRERAMKMRAEICENAKASEDSCEEAMPLVRSKPPRPRKKNREPLFEEDVIDGFAILAFKSFDDLERCVRSAEKVGSRILDPCPDRVKEVSKKKPYIKAGGSHSSSEQGYICDSESEDDPAVSDGESDFFTAATKSAVESCLGVDGNTAGARPGLVLRAPETLIKPPPVAVSHHQNSYSNGPVDPGNHIGSLHSGLSPGPTSGPPTKVTPTPYPYPPPLSSVGPPKHPSLNDCKTSLFEDKPPPYLEKKPLPYLDQKPPPYIDQKPPQPFLDQKPPPFVDQKPPPALIDQKPPQFLPTPAPEKHNLSHTPSPATSVPHAAPTSPAPNHYPPTTTSSTTPTTTTSPTASVATIPVPHNHVGAGGGGSTNGNSISATTNNSSSSSIVPSKPLANGPLSVPGPVPHRPASSAALGKYSVVSLVSGCTPSTNSGPPTISSGPPTISSNSTNSSTTSNSIYSNSIIKSDHLSHSPVVSPAIGGQVPPVPLATVAGSLPGNATVTPDVSSTPYHPSVPHTHGLTPSPGVPRHPGLSTSTTATPPVPDPAIGIKIEPGEPTIPPPPTSHGKPPPPVGSISSSSLHPAAYSHSNLNLHPHPASTATCATTPSVTQSSPQHTVTVSSSQSELLPSHPRGINSVKVEPGVTVKGSPSLPSAPRTTTPSHVGLPPAARHSPASRHSPARHSPRTQDHHVPLYSGYPGNSTSLVASSHSAVSKPWSSPLNSLASSNSSRLSTLPRPIIPPPSFPLGAPPVSAPLPPTGMFAPPIPAPQTLLSHPHHLAQDPLVQADILRRELDSRFLATQDRTLGIGGPALGPLGAVPLLRTDVHHHQHQHTHVHQHLLPPHMPPPPPLPLAAPAPTGLFSHSAAPSLFKEVSKSGIDQNSIYRPGGALGSTYPPGLSPLVTPATTTPFAPPSHISAAPPKPLRRQKTGRWNAMHVRIAWEIFYDQQKQANEKSGVKITGTDHLLRPSGSAVGSRMYSLPRPPEMASSLIGSAGPSHRLESPFLNSHISPSIPGLSGLRYGNAPPPVVSSAPSFHHPGVVPTSMSGPPPGSMFSREPIPSGLSLPTPTTHDPYRLRAPTPYGPTGGTWPMKPDSSFFERERREQEERERREREERERREKEERERREREEMERREKEERERREREERERERREERERERERERRAEHEKERMARLDAERTAAARRDESRSPIARHPEVKDPHLGAAPPLPGYPPPLGKMDVLKGDSRPSSRPPSKPDMGRTKLETKDDVMIVGSKEGNPRHPAHHLSQHLNPPTSLLPPHSSPFLSHSIPHHSLPSHTLPSHFAPSSSSSPMDRTRLMQGVYPGAPPPGPHMGAWPDPFRDPYRPPGALHDPVSVARAHDLAARESLLDRAREEHFMRANSLGGANPLGSLIWNERYREQQARELINHERERQMAGVAAAAAAGLPPGLYSSSSLLGPSGSSLLPPSMKTGSHLNPSHPPNIHPGLNPQGLGALHPGVSHPSHLGGPGLPPPLISSLRGPSPTLPRPPDKKEPPR